MAHDVIFCSGNRFYLKALEMEEQITGDWKAHVKRVADTDLIVEDTNS